ncbi:DNA replication and repair protein RecF, partial [Haemophilus influenzae]
RSI